MGAASKMKSLRNYAFWSLMHPVDTGVCWILQEYTTFGEPNTNPLTFFEESKQHKVIPL